jgi:hypothetical protein
VVLDPPPVVFNRVELIVDFGEGDTNVTGDKLSSTAIHQNPFHLVTFLPPPRFATLLHTEIISSVLFLEWYISHSTLIRVGEMRAGEH